MRALKLNKRVLDSLHALRMEPFIRFLTSTFDSYDPRSKSLLFRYTAADLMLKLVLAGHQPMAIVMRNQHIGSITLQYAGNQVAFDAIGTDPAGNEVPVNLQAIAPGIDAALIALLLPDIERVIDKASRYVSAFDRLVFTSPELLLSASKSGITYRVRTDTPRIDEQLMNALDKALSLTNRVVITLRVIRLDEAGRHEAIVAPQVVQRSQPLRPLALQAINEHFGKHGVSNPAVSRRSPTCHTIQL